MLYIIINAYGEPKATERAVNSFLEQNIKRDYKIIVVDPFPEVRDFIKEKFGKNKNVEFFLDPGEGKSYSLNLMLSNLYKENKDILIFTDGDVYTEKNSVNEILKLFKDSKIGCVTGRPVSINSRKNFFGYVSHFLCDVAAHDISRKKRKKNKGFLEATGYLFAIRNGIIKKFPLDVAEDAIIPYLIWKRGYKIGYADKAFVNVKWPDNFKDWVNQKKRAAASHIGLDKYAKEFPKVKSFFGEFSEGIVSMKTIFSYPKNLRESIYTFALFPLRFWVWFSLYFDLIILRKKFVDGWRGEFEVQSTKTLD